MMLDRLDAVHVEQLGDSRSVSVEVGEIRSGGLG
jgi:hypothetical protein